MTSPTTPAENDPLGLIVPIVGELPEVAYQFDNPFVLGRGDYRATFDAEATPWDRALRATLDWWQHEI